MSDIVAKDFKTVNRRFKAGESVSAADIDGPVTFEQWKERGFIKSAEEPAVGRRFRPPSASE